jgi:hypothetical protein
MLTARLFPTTAVLGVGIVVGYALFGRIGTDPSFLRSAAAQQSAPSTATDVAALQADVETLKQKATDQAHVMVSVAYDFNNLWFAGQHGNWPLAQFYWNEVRSHLRWAVRVFPVRKDSQGTDIKLGEILEAVENSPLAQLQEAITAQDQNKFVAAYRFSLEGCYACHKASEKPFLRPQIPTYPAEPTTNFDPQSTWPR